MQQPLLPPPYIVGGGGGGVIIDEASRRRRGEELRVAAISMRSRTVGSLALALSIITLIAQLVLVVWGAIDSSSPAFYRAVLLIPAAIFTLSIWSVYADKELFDFETAMIFGFVSLIADIVLVVAELIRWNDSTEPPLINDYIATNFASQVSIVPIIALIVFVLHVIAVIVLIAWRNGWDNYSIKMRRANDIYPDPNFDNEVAVLSYENEDAGGIYNEEVFARAKAAADMRRRNVLMRRTWVDTLLGVLAVLQLFVYYGVTVIALLYTSSNRASAFYRGYFLLPPAMFSGFEISFFAHVPPRWRWASLVLCLLAVASVIAGDIFEIPRWMQCFGTSGPPIGVVDTDICNDAGWVGLVVPWAVIIATVLLGLSLIFSIVRLVMRDKPLVASLVVPVAPVPVSLDQQLALQQQQQQLAADDGTGNMQQFGTAYGRPRRNKHIDDNDDDESDGKRSRGNRSRNSRARRANRSNRD